MLAVERSGPAHCSAVVCLTYSHNWHRPDISMQSELWRIKVYKWGKSAKLNEKSDISHYIRENKN